MHDVYGIMQISVTIKNLANSTKYIFYWFVVGKKNSYVKGFKFWKPSINI